MKEGLSNKNVFLGGCNLTKDGNEDGKTYLSRFAKQTNSTVVSSDHLIQSGYKYDGSDYLSKPHGDLTEPRKSNSSYHMATPTTTANAVYDLKIDKMGKFTWGDEYK